MPEVALVVLGVGLVGGLILIVAGAIGVDERRKPIFRPMMLRRPRLSHRGLRWRGPLALSSGVLVWLVSGWPVAGLAIALFVGFLPWLFSAGAVAKERIERLEALETWLRRLSDVVAVGNTGLVSAVQGSTREAPPVLARELMTLAHRLRTWDVQDALLEFADDLDDQVGDTAVAGLCVAYRQGAGAAHLLRALAGQVAEDIIARRTAEAERARRRSTARILLGIWAVMFLGLALFGSSMYASVYATPVGQAVLAVVLGLVGASAAWLRRLGLAPIGARFLTSQTRRRP
ncbi:type II secretion system protein [Amycolatopsis sp. WAC 04197]|uniref:type II secretion system F family protein n=1 Tax=Amycolatopsis sp. WAC 04197 TaxID=2203199 RepID=UPI000F7AA1E1|nr:type II secretion system protein [Amycolatopsis sp. WAC 04197]RSN45290.1 type II secretion system protein [Amycolatopsis sp. WAC 04197]